MDNLDPVERRDYLYVALFTGILYGVVLTVGGPLTMHEGVLSQTTKAMLADHDWLVPHYGQAPWLERPPLPQWISCAICTVIGHCDQEWNIRIGAALGGLTTVLLTVWLAGRLFGRGVGILSGLALATMYNFLRYSTLAEADIFLAPIVAGTLCIFAYTEILRTPAANESRNFFGGRPWCVLGFFVLLGMTNLAKGLVFGTVVVLAPLCVFVLWNFRWQSMIGFLILFGWANVAKALHLGTAVSLGPLLAFVFLHILCFARYCWLWGWLAFAIVALPWPLLVYLRYPDAVEIWRFDLVGRLNGNYLGEPPWYYLECLAWVPQPWSLAAFVGLWLTFRKVWHDGSLANRFVWCWAWMPIIIFSMPDGKHHHYMLHYLAPWAILAAQGVVWAWQRVGETRTLWRPSVAIATGFACLFVVYSGAFAFKGAFLNRSLDDTAFLREVRRKVPLDQTLMINSADEALEGLRMQFYIGDTVYFLHNLSFVRDDRVHADDVYVVTRFNRMAELKKYGRVEELMRCKEARREKNEEERWTLFRLHLRDDLPRKNADVRISPMQAMYREPGPVLD